MHIMKTPNYWKKWKCRKVIHNKNNPHDSKNVAGRGVSHTFLCISGTIKAMVPAQLNSYLIPFSNSYDFCMAKPKKRRMTVHKTQKKKVPAQQKNLKIRGKKKKKEEAAATELTENSSTTVIL